MKRTAFQWYSDRLNGIPGIQIHNPGPDIESAYWLMTVVWDERYPFDKREAATRLEAAGLDTRPFFSPLSSLEAYAVYSSQEWAKCNYHAYHIGSRGINLPSSLTLTEEEVDFVCSTLKKVLFFETGARASGRRTYSPSR